MRNLVLVVIILVVAFAAYYLGQQSSKPELPPAPQQPVSDITTGNNTEQKPAPIKYPVNNTTPADGGAVNTPAVTPLPGLDHSDDSVREALAGIYDPLQLDKLFNFKSAIRHFVVTVDNMTASKLPQKFKYTRLPADSFLVIKDADGGLSIDPKNYNRYTPYIRFVETVDMNGLAQLYFRYYPLFQQAYQDLGYPDRYFNDRLVAVIDHLLATPDVRDPVKLKQPVVYYTFADPALEQLSAGQKLMIRIGHDNAVRVKECLRRLRVELTHKPSEE